MGHLPVKLDVHTHRISSWLSLSLSLSLLVGELEYRDWAVRPFGGRNLAHSAAFERPRPSILVAYTISCIVSCHPRVRIIWLFPTAIQWGLFSFSVLNPLKTLTVKRFKWKNKVISGRKDAEPLTNIGSISDMIYCLAVSGWTWHHL